jgi:hypothetical protein
MTASVPCRHPPSSPERYLRVAALSGAALKLSECTHQEQLAHGRFLAGEDHPLLNELDLHAALGQLRHDPAQIVKKLRLRFAVESIMFSESFLEERLAARETLAKVVAAVENAIRDLRTLKSLNAASAPNATP